MIWSIYFLLYQVQGSSDKKRNNICSYCTRVRREHRTCQVVMGWQTPVAVRITGEGHRGGRRSLAWNWGEKRKSKPTLSTQEFASRAAALGQGTQFTCWALPLQLHEDWMSVPLALGTQWQGEASSGDAAGPWMRYREIKIFFPGLGSCQRFLSKAKSIQSHWPEILPFLCLLIKVVAQDTCKKHLTK